MPIAMYCPTYKSKVIFALIAGLVGTFLAALTGFIGSPGDDTTKTLFFAS